MGLFVVLFACAGAMSAWIAGRRRPHEGPTVVAPHPRDSRCACRALHRSARDLVRVVLGRRLGPQLGRTAPSMRGYASVLALRTPSRAHIDQDDGYSGRHRRGAGSCGPGRPGDAEAAVTAPAAEPAGAVEQLGPEPGADLPTAPGGPSQEADLATANRACLLTRSLLDTVAMCLPRLIGTCGGVQGPRLPWARAGGGPRLRRAS